MHHYPEILRDKNGDPIPQYFDGTNWLPLVGGPYGQRMELLGPNGQPISSQNRLPVDISADGQPVSESNPLPVKGEMHLSGQIAVKSWDDLPAPDGVPLGTTAQLIGTFDVRQADGTDWVEVIL